MDVQNAKKLEIVLIDIAKALKGVDLALVVAELKDLSLPEIAELIGVALEEFKK